MSIEKILDYFNKLFHCFIIFPFWLKALWIIFIFITILIFIILATYSLRYCKKDQLIQWRPPESYKVPPIEQPRPLKPGEIQLGWIVVQAPLSDKNGNEATIGLYTLHSDAAWKFFSDKIILWHEVTFNLKKHLLSHGMQNVMNDSYAIICVGTASEEGNIAEEEGRAAKRAETLDLLIRETMPKALQVYTLSLGQHKKTTMNDVGEDHSKTSSQRRVVLIRVEKKSDEFDLDGSLNILEKMLLKNSNLPFQFSDYTMFDLKKKT